MQRKLSTFDKDMRNYSKKAGDIVRQLSFAGIALIWAFRNSNDGKTSIPDALLFPALLFTVTLLFDVLQYLIAAEISGFYFRYREKQFPTGANPDIDAPVSLFLPQNFLYYAKAITISWAFLLTIKYIWSVWKI